MTLESKANKNRYVGNGVATDFPFTFKVWKKNQVSVFIGDGRYDSDVSGQCGIEITSTGGTVKFPVAPAAGVVIAIRRKMPYTQEDDYRNGTRFDSEEVEDRFDQDCAERQDLKLDIERSIKVPETAASSGTDLVEDLMQAQHDVLTALAEAGDVTGASRVVSSGALAPRSLSDRFADIVNVRDFGAVGDGETDDTAAIALAAAAGGTLFFPRGTYVLSQDADFDGLAGGMSGPGEIRFMGLDYPAERKIATDFLWAGKFSYWPMGHSAAVSGVERVQIPAGVTAARQDFATGCSVYHADGALCRDAVLVRRNEGNASKKYASIILNLSEEESQPLRGQNVVLQFFARDAGTYTGEEITAQILYSEEPQQSILSASGFYSSGNVIAATENFAPEDRPRSAPFWITSQIPPDATQVAVRFAVPFAGTALANDGVVFENIVLCIGNKPATPVELDYSTVEHNGRTRYQTSYPYGFPRGTQTKQGIVSAVAVASETSWAFALNIQFNPPMMETPKFIFQNRKSGTENRLWDETSDVSIYGLPFNLSDTGVTITNNGEATAGHVYTAHWTAEVKL